MLILRLLTVIAITAVIMLLIARSKRARTAIFTCLAILSAATGFIIYTLGFLPKDAGYGDTMWAVLRGMFNMFGMFSVRENYDKLVGSPNAAFFYVKMLCGKSCFGSAIYSRLPRPYTS